MYRRSENRSAAGDTRQTVMRTYASEDADDALEAYQAGLLELGGMGKK